MYVKINLNHNQMIINYFIRVHITYIELDQIHPSNNYKK